MASARFAAACALTVACTTPRAIETRVVPSASAPAPVIAAIAPPPIHREPIAIPDSLAVVDSATVWATIGSDTAATELVRSDDGGATWKSAMQPLREMQTFAARDRVTAWTAGVDLQGDAMKVRVARTTDGGATWTTSEVRTKTAIQSVTLAFSSAKDGVMRLQPQTGMSSRWGLGPYVATHDGGETWRPTPPPRWTIRGDCSTCGGNLANGDHVALPPPPPRTTCAHWNMNDVQMNADGSALMIASCNGVGPEPGATAPTGDAIYFLSAGSDRWTFVSLVESDSRVMLLRPDRLWNIHDGRLTESIDHGATFHARALPEGASADDLTDGIETDNREAPPFVSPKLTLMRLKNAIYRTDDGGTSWKKVFPRAD